MSEPTDESRGGRRPWLRAWLVVGLASWTTIGVLLVTRANNLGLVDDISISPYHVVGYAALLTLAVYAAWAFFRAMRRGEWRRAYPPLYGGLGLGFVLLVGWVVLDPIWRTTLGIGFNIEGGLAPPRLLIPAALVLLAIGPVREAIATRTAPGLAPGELGIRWAGVVATGLVGGALTLVAFNPISSALSDFTVNSGTDNTEIWTMAPDGSGQTRLLTALGDGVDYSLPAWSPDGTRIAFTAWTNEGGLPQNFLNADQAADIWSMAADGSDRRRVVEGGDDHAWIPAWSPDGQWIAYTRTPLGPAPAAAAGPQPGDGPGAVGPPSLAAGASIWIVRPDGTGNARLSAEGADAFGAVWSPDGTSVAFGVTGAGGSEIHVATVSNGALTGERAITADGANSWGQAWSPDGTSIAYNSDRSGNDEIWVVAATGGEPRQLTDDGAGDWVPAWSPDGSMIAFVSERSGDAEVWSMAADGSDPRNLSNHPFHFDGTWSVTWAPDGNHLAYAVAAYQDAATSGWVREDLAAAQALLFAVALSIVALLIVALGAPLGSFTLAMGIIAFLSALPTDSWRFLPGALVAGALVDTLVRSVRLSRRGRVAAAALPALTTLAIGLTIGLGGTLTWSITLLLGVSLFSGLIGLGIAEAVERLLQRPARASEAASDVPA